MFIPFGEYTPDLPAYKNPGSAYVNNVIPMGDGYEPFPALTVYSDALSARCQGAGSFRDADGTVFNFSGDAAKLYKMASALWSNVSKVGGYATNTDERWSFTQFGRSVIAANYTDATQTFLMGTDSLFSNLSATCPKARYLGVVNDFLVLGNINDGAAYPNRVQWSPQGNPGGVWGTDEATQADYQDLNAANGWIKQVIGGEYGVIFQERAIVRMTYAGSPLVFQFDVVEEGRGTQAPGSVIKVGNLIYFIDTDGFYVFNGSSSIPIGDNKVDKTFLSNLDDNYLYRIQAVRDPTKPIIYWIYPGSGNTGGNCNAIIAYNWVTNKFSPVDLTGNDLEFIYNLFVEGYTLDQLDSVSSSIDALTFSLDSGFWTGGTIQLGGFNANHKVVYLNGSALEATIDTTEVRPNETGRAEIIRIRPAVDSSSATIKIGIRNTQSESVSYGMASSQMSDGSCPVRANARFVRARVSIPAGDSWTHAQGVEIEEMVNVGMR